MSSQYATRISRLEETIRRNNKCTTCWDTATAIVFVPEGEDPDAPEWTPTACPGCGVPLRHYRQIVGISEAEAYGPGGFLEQAG